MNAKSNKENSNVPEKILNRIRKLYAMSGQVNTSVHESAIAAKRCLSLMQKYGVTEDQLETSDFDSVKACEIKSKIPTYIKLLSTATGLLHDCLVVRNRGAIEFRGYAIDAQVASMTFEYLSESLARCLRQEKTAGNIEAGRASSYDYRIGFSSELLKRCKEIDAERRAADNSDTNNGNALVVRKLAIVKRECGSGLSKGRQAKYSYRRGDSHEAGKRAGSAVSLNKQMSSGTKMKALT